MIICIWYIIMHSCDVQAEAAQSPNSPVSINSAQPEQGVPLSLSINTSEEYTVTWYVGDAEVSTAETYTPAASDYEKWIRVVLAAKDSGRTLGEDSIYFSKLPVIYINTEDGSGITTKTSKAAAMDIQGNAEFPDQYSGDITIKVRGNSSSGFSQKPYKIKLDTSTDLFGMGKNKHWVLLSNRIDLCGLRNKMGSSLSKQLGLANMDMVYVDVVVNGKYTGFYELVEHIRIGDSRIAIYNWEDEAETIAKNIYKANTETLTKDDRDAIEDQLCNDFSWITSGQVSYQDITYTISDYYTVSDNITGGYLFEMSSEMDEVSKFITPGEIRVMVNSPEYIYTCDRAMDYIQNYWQDFESAISSIDGYNSDSVHYSELADFDSMVSYWLTMEILGNDDAVWRSRYSYKDVDGLLTFGPAWDFDWGCASYTVYITGFSATGWKLSSGSLWNNFVDDPYFQVKAAEKYWDNRKYLERFVEDDGMIDETVAYLSEAGRVCDALYPGGRSFQTDAAVLKNYLKERLAWLDQVFATEESATDAMKLTGCVNPYTKSSEKFAVTFVNGMDDVISAHAPADGMIRSSQDASVRVDVTDLDTDRVAVYVNGLIMNTYDVMDGKCTFTVTQETLNEEMGSRNVISLIGYDASGNVTGTNYASVIVIPDSHILGTPYKARDDGAYYDVTVPHIMINQAYGGGADGYASHHYIELYNPTSMDIDLSSWSLHYRSSKDGENNQAWSKLDLSGTIPAHSSYLVRCSAIANPNSNAIGIDRYDQTWDQVIHNKGISIVLTANQDALDAEADLYDNDNHTPLISDYVDLYSVSGNDTDTEKKIDKQKAPYSEKAASTVQSKKKTIRRIGFADTDDNTISGDFEVIDYSFSVKAYIDWITPRSSMDGAWDYQSNARPTYTVTYECGEGSTPIPAEEYGFYKTITRPEDPVKEGYTFAGWHTDAALMNEYDFENQEMPVDHVVLYAKWSINSYHVVYEPNGGSAVADHTYFYHENMIAPEIPAREGHTFTGWYEDAELTIEYAFGKMPAKDLTLYAGWAANTYYITYESGGGSAVEKAAYPYGTDIIMPDNPTREGHTFTGWYKDQELTEKYSFEKMPAADLTLYAGWVKNVYHVVYVDYNGIILDVQEIPYEESASVPDAPERDGYTFVGWTSTADHVTDHMIIIAVYQKNADSDHNPLSSPSPEPIFSPSPAPDAHPSPSQSPLPNPDQNVSQDQNAVQNQNNTALNPSDAFRVTNQLTAVYKKAVANKKAKTVKVKNVKSITLYTKKLKTAQLSVTGIESSVSWHSSNASVAKVSKNGKVTAVGKGSAYITAKAGDVSCYCKINVKKAKITFAQKTSSVMMQAGKKQSVGANILPKGIVTYKTSNQRIVSVSKKGMMKAKSAGQAVITVQANGISKKLKVMVHKIS